MNRTHALTSSGMRMPGTRPSTNASDTKKSKLRSAAYSPAALVRRMKSTIGYLDAALEVATTSTVPSTPESSNPLPASEPTALLSSDTTDEV